MRREEVVSPGDEHAAGERQVQLGPLPVFGGRELRCQTCVSELAGDAQPGELEIDRKGVHPG